MEGVRAIEVYRRRGHWLSDPEEGIDAWNERMVAAARGETRRRHARAATAAARTALLAAVDTLTVDELRSPDGWSWAYDCLPRPRPQARGDARAVGGDARLAGPRRLMPAEPTRAQAG